MQYLTKNNVLGDIYGYMHFYEVKRCENVQRFNNALNHIWEKFYHELMDPLLFLVNLQISKRIVEMLQFCIFLKMLEWIKHITIFHIICGMIKEIMLNIVFQKGCNLEYAVEELRNDKEIVFAAVKQDGLTLKYAAPELKMVRKLS